MIGSTFVYLANTIVDSVLKRSNSLVSLRKWGIIQHLNIIIITCEQNVTTQRQLRTHWIKEIGVLNFYYRDELDWAISLLANSCSVMTFRLFRFTKYLDIFSL